MPLITGSVFLAGALLSCVLPIGLLVVFAAYFVRDARRHPPNATPDRATPDQRQAAVEATSPDVQG